MENKTEKEMEQTGVPLNSPVSPQPKPKKQPKPKYKSRATRNSEAAGILNTAAGEIRGISEEITGLRESFEESQEETTVEKLDEETTTKILELVGKASAHFSDIESAKEEFEGLQGEMESWRDNMQGTNLEATDKYSRVDQERT